MRSQTAAVTPMRRRSAVEGEAPLDGGGLGRGVQAGGRADVFGGERRQISAAQFGVRTPAHDSTSCVVADAPLVHELVVVQVLVDDDVQPGEAPARRRCRDGRAASTSALGAQPRQTRVDGDDLRAHLHALRRASGRCSRRRWTSAARCPTPPDVGAAIRRIGVAVRDALPRRPRWGSRPCAAVRRTCAAGSTSSPEEADGADVGRAQAAPPRTRHCQARCCGRCRGSRRWTRGRSSSSTLVSALHDLVEASSHVMRSHLFSPRSPARFRGYFRRSGWFTALDQSRQRMHNCRSRTGPAGRPRSSPACRPCV